MYVTYARELGLDLDLREYISQREMIRAFANQPGAGTCRIHYDENDWF